MGLNHGKNIGQQSRDTLPLSKKSDMVNSIFTVMHMIMIFVRQNYFRIFFLLRQKTSCTSTVPC